MTSTGNELTVNFAATREQSPRGAVRSIKDQLDTRKPTAVFFFCGLSYDLAELGKILDTSFSCPVIGCTTAGEISPPAGFSSNSFVAMAVTSPRLRLVSYLIDGIDTFSLLQNQKLQRRVADDFPENTNGSSNRFGLMLIDGMSYNEEQIIDTVTASLAPLPIIGGSAGDDLRFSETFIYSGGTFQSNAATLTVVETSHPFKPFQTQHFKPTDTKLVITEANPRQRLVTEINGYPAASEYARLIGVERDALSTEVFSLHPIMLKIGGRYHVRAIQRANSDDSLSFYCAIDTGLVMTVGRGENILQATKSALEEVVREISRPRLILGCDCILRKYEMETQQHVLDKMAGLLSAHNFFGFSTYGEQYNGVHVNQTLTGVVLGE